MKRPLARITRLLCILLVFFPIAAAAQPCVALAVSLNGQFTHSHAGKNTELKSGDELFPDSVLYARPGTPDPFVGVRSKYTSFTVSVFPSLGRFSSLEKMDDRQRNLVLAKIGGTASTRLWQWSDGALTDSLGQGARDSLNAVVAQLLGKREKPLVLLVEALKTPEGVYGSELGIFLGQRLTEALVAHPYAEIFDSGAVESILEAQELAYALLATPGQSIALSKLPAIDAVLRGRASVSSGRILISLSLSSVESGLLLSTASIELDMADLPQGIKPLPANYSAAQEIRAQIDSVLPAAGSIKLQAWLNRGVDPVYFDGELLSLKLRSDRDCYLRIYHIDVTGKIQLLFPNRRMPKDFLAANASLTVPDPSTSLKFVMRKPFGIEFLKIIASERPFPTGWESVSLTAGGGREPGSYRGIVLQGIEDGAEGTYAEALLSYTVLDSRYAEDLR